ncbi:uncharacterized protein V1516DRAFT_663301 [Lipomyces oligophaga]|uniref:uncharacterized protein n=1 Tax=Lipomyces oligophaga TaxID=45792 RepID=UPI0034CF8EA2
MALTHRSPNHSFEVAGSDLESLTLADSGDSSKSNVKITGKRKRRAIWLLLGFLIYFCVLAGQISLLRPNESFAQIKSFVESVEESALDLARPGTAKVKSAMSTIVQWDDNSFLINGERQFIVSGEFHHWRLPVQHSYFDIFQKMRALGYNTVTVPFNWGYHHISESQMIFHGVGRDIQSLLEDAKRAGLFVIARPGPYFMREHINAGGIPVWLLDNSDADIGSTTSRDFTNAWMRYFAHLIPTIARNQIDMDGAVIAIKLEDDYDKSFLRLISEVIKKMGIVVPIIGSDLSSDTSPFDIQSINLHREEFSCSNISDYIDSNLLIHSGSDKYKFMAEYQVGSFDNWGGTGYDHCELILGPDYINSFQKSLVAHKFTALSSHIVIGGTNWGSIGCSTSYTSFDYIAPMGEGGQIREKTSESKLLWTFLQASPSLLSAKFVSDSISYQYSDNEDVFVTELRDPNTGTGYYVIRAGTDYETMGMTFYLDVDIKQQGKTRIPFGRPMALRPHESKIVVTDYAAGDITIGYSTMEIFTWTLFNEKPIIVMYGAFEDYNQIYFRGLGDEKLKLYSTRGSRIKQNSNIAATVTQSNDLDTIFLLNDEQEAIIQTAKYSILLFNRPDIYRVWAPIIEIENEHGIPEKTKVIVFGPYLVRNATVVDFVNKYLSIFGDIDLEENDSTRVEVFISRDFSGVLWNSKLVTNGHWTVYGSYIFEVIPPSNNLGWVEVPVLTQQDWKMIDSLPELEVEYDDSMWTICDKFKYSNNEYPPITLPVLYAGDYGYHVGVIIYRGRFQGNQASKLYINIWGGTAFGFTIWLNGRYFASHRGSPDLDHLETEYAFSKDSILNEGENIVLVVLDHMGYDDEELSEIKIAPRGIRGIKLLCDDSDSNECGLFYDWRIQGNHGGEAFDDLLRAPYNEGGSYALRAGAHFPFTDPSKWREEKPFFDHAKYPEGQKRISGIKFYRADVMIKISDLLSVPLSLRVAANEESSKSNGIRAEFFLNGWQVGKYVSDIGPQIEFPIPIGILDADGWNTIGVQIWTMDNDENSPAGFLEMIEFVQKGKILSGYGRVSGEYYSGLYVARDE